MTTKARIAALQWFHDRGDVDPPLHVLQPEWLTERMLRSLIRKGQLGITNSGWSLTDKGRQDLHEATK